MDARSKLEIWLFLVSLTLPATLKATLVGGEFDLGVPEVPCMYVFGDSLFDNGNNNDLVTTAKANYPPYGVDFPAGPTGRFSNGRNIMDFIAEFLGFEDYIRPMALATDEDILVGVNYASGGSGILDETAVQLGEVISMNRQLQHHKKTVSRIVKLLGSEESASQHLSRCIYPVGMGNNDYINNYLSPQYNSSILYTPRQFAQVLIQEYSQQLLTLYRYGARKVAVFALGKIGCTPAEMATYNAEKCVQKIEDYTKLFNDRLQLLVDELNGDLSDAKFIYIDAHDEINSSDTSITDTTNPCCVVSLSTGKGQCVPDQVPCIERETMAFWDGFHPTETASLLIAQGAYKGFAIFGTNKNIDSSRHQARFQ